MDITVILEVDPELLVQVEGDTSTEVILEVAPELLCTLEE